MNEQSIKNIVSAFLKQPAEQILSETRIDRSAIASSIVIHRMYAKLHEAGFIISDYSQIDTYGQLLTRLNGSTGQVPSSKSQNATPLADKMQGEDKNTFANPGAGIDIESAANLPRVDDFRESEFYRLNFSPSEISHCILQPDPYASFAGLFAAKEAMVKAGYPLHGAPFNQILINHNAAGAPVASGYSISISHCDGLAVAVAISSVQELRQTPAIAPSQVEQGSSKMPLLLSLLALLGAIVSVVIALKS